VTIEIGVPAIAGGVAVQRNGTIVVAAGSERSVSALIRVTPLGKLADPGITVIAGKVNAIAVGSDDTIVAVGEKFTIETGTDFLVARFLADGRPDTRFGQIGWTRTNVGNRDLHDIARAVVVQEDGKIVVAGQSVVRLSFLSWPYSFATVRYQRDGSLDRGFGDNGRVITRMGAAREDHASAALVTPGGKIILAGYADFPHRRSYHSEFAVVRYLANGKPDHQFGQGGKAALLGIGSLGFAATTDAQGRILVGGSGWSENRREPVLLVARYRSDGTVDESFGTAGIFEHRPGHTVTSLVVQPDGKIIAAGGFLYLTQDGITKTTRSWSFLQPGLGILLRMNSDGSLDQSFTEQGLSFRADDLAVQPDGKLLLAGASGGKIILARLNPDGSPDRGFDGQGIRPPRQRPPRRRPHRRQPPLLRGWQPMSRLSLRGCWCFSASRSRRSPCSC
jgi:uncharacterized delta-60 repeat protein